MQIRPQIDFRHVLTELSVNRNDPCEVVRELVSNAYDARASKIRFAATAESKSFVFFDNGTGLSREKEVNGITPYAAFFSIGRSTKKRGDGGVGYKCQGSKLCFACTRFLLITRSEDDTNFVYRTIDNPRDNLATEFDVSPEVTSSPWDVLATFFAGSGAATGTLLQKFEPAFFASDFVTGTLIAVRGFDTDGFGKYFLSSSNPEQSYIYNYIRHFTKHGDTRVITDKQGFKAAHIYSLQSLTRETDLAILADQEFVNVPYGFNYLAAENEPDIKGPLEIARLRDGRFWSRSAKRIHFSGKTYCFVLAIDGNRRAHDGYASLDRKGATKSGVRLSDQRGAWIAASGVKICRVAELFLRPELEDYDVLAEGEASSHYHLVIDGDFELVTNRNGLSRSASQVLEDAGFIAELKKFLDHCEQTDDIFRTLLSRLRREQSEARLSQQILILKDSKERMKSRERFVVDGKVYVSPEPGEEYLVGVLYAELGGKVPEDSPHKGLWRRVLTFSTQGIDSIASRSEKTFKSEELIAIEYKFAFSNSGPFNHALAIVDMIVSWELSLDTSLNIRDDYGCYGKVDGGDGVWTISDINHEEGDSYGDRKIVVVCLRDLIKKTFPDVVYRTPPPQTP